MLTDTIISSRYSPIINQVFCCMFYTALLWSNILCYASSFLVIIIFALVVLVGFMRGNPEFINPRRGLTDEEIGKIRQ
jgi:Ring finger domain